MKVLILTSKDNIYSNFILNNLIKKNLFNDNELIVFEQDWIIPNKSKIKSIIKYLKTSGFYYVFAQILKNYLFLFLRFITLLNNDKKSIFFPYYRNNLKSFYRRKFQGLKTEESFKDIKKINPDLILSIFSREIIPENILKIPKYGCINLHPSLLPKYRGVSPVFWCLANNDKHAGVTLHYMDNKIDTGSIISQKKFPIKEFSTEHSLYMHCSNVGSNLIINFFKNQKEKKLKLNDHLNGSYYSLPSKISVKKFLDNGYLFYNFKEFFK